MIPDAEILMMEFPLNPLLCVCGLCQTLSFLPGGRVKASFLAFPGELFYSCCTAVSTGFVIDFRGVVLVCARRIPDALPRVEKKDAIVL